NRKKLSTQSDEKKPLVAVTPNESIARLPRPNQNTSSHRAPKLVPQIFQRNKRDNQNKSGARENTNPNSSMWGETDDQIIYKHVDDPTYIKIMNCLMFCGLAQDVEILWNFARFVIERGGLYFIIIYWFMLFVLVCPVLHMEVFVGQWCQSGIVKTMRSYGKGFEFIGILIMIVLFFRATIGLHFSYPLAKHFLNLLHDPEGIVTCKSNQSALDFERFCVSLVNDMKCRRERGPDFVSYGTRCTNNTAHITMATSMAKYYATNIRQILFPAEYDTNRLLYLVTVCLVIALVGAAGFTVARYFLAIVFAYYAAVFLLMLIPFFSVRGTISSMLHTISAATTPESLFEIQVC
ncbi:hypothetical protein GCK32_013884, partial [Trichostrongylus colubriformis]